MPLKIEIIGRPISKKRNYVIGKRGMFLSKSYRQWEKDALKQLEMVTERFQTDLMVRYTFEIKGRYKVDWDNLAASMGDLLQEAGIIENDELIVEAHVKKVRGCKDWKTIIEIAKC